MLVNSRQRTVPLRTCARPRRSGTTLSPGARLGLVGTIVAGARNVDGRAAVIVDSPSLRSTVM
jgi:hypothetical protein